MSASAPSTEANSTPLVQQVASELQQTHALILLTGCNENFCVAFLESLIPALQENGHPVSLRPSLSSTTLFAQVAHSLGLENVAPSAASLEKYLADRNTFLLCTTENGSPDFFEQVRQLSNIHPQGGRLSIVLCGTKTLPRLLPVSLRQRITAAYRLDAPAHRTVRRFALAGALIALGVSLLATNRISAWMHATATPHPQFMLESSLKAGPVLMQPPPAPAPPTLSHVFETEAEAEAALQRGSPAPKPAQQ